jgi:hypothetical protein
VDFHAGPSSLGPPAPNTNVTTAQFIELASNVLNLSESLVPDGSKRKLLFKGCVMRTLKKIIRLILCMKAIVCGDPGYYVKEICKGV